MSTSSIPQGLGECVVCGKESSTRCSKCNSAGLGWMFFCGQDHQRLVWRFHRRVCGIKGFRWPEFSPGEIEDALSMARRPPRSDDPSCFDHIAQGMGLAFDKKDKLGSFKTMLEGGQGAERQSTSLERSHEVARLRLMCLTIRTMATLHGRRANIEDIKTVLIEEPLNLIAFQQLSVVYDFETYDEQPWFDGFQQRFLNWFAVFRQLTIDGCQLTPAMRKCLHYTPEVWTGFIRSVVSKTHPDVASRFLSTFELAEACPFPASQKLISNEELYGER